MVAFNLAHGLLFGVVYLASFASGTPGYRPKPCQEITAGGPLYIGSAQAEAVDAPIDLDGSFANSGINQEAHFDKEQEGIHFLLTWQAQHPHTVLQTYSTDKSIKNTNKYVYKVSTSSTNQPGPIISQTVKWYYLFGDDSCETVNAVDAPQLVAVQRIRPM